MIYAQTLPRTAPNYPSHSMQLLGVTFPTYPALSRTATSPVAKPRPDAAIVQAFLIKAAMAGGSPRVNKTRKTRARKVCH